MTSCDLITYPNLFSLVTRMGDTEDVGENIKKSRSPAIKGTVNIMFTFLIFIYGISLEGL